MEIRLAKTMDFETLAAHDRHIAPQELRRSLDAGRVLVVYDEGTFVGWLRWNLFWDSIPFMNMLYLLDGCRRQGIGRQLVGEWERRMAQEGYTYLMTSTQSDEQAQHFYRKMGYNEIGAMVPLGEPLEILFGKKV